MSEQKQPRASPVIGEIAKVIRVTGLKVTQSVDGQWLCLKLPIDMDGHQLIFQICHTEIDDLVGASKSPPRKWPASRYFRALAGDRP